MKYLLLVLLCSCYHMKNARFVDESDTGENSGVWICVPDDEPTNPLGLMCADIANTVVRPTAPEAPASM